MPVKLPRNYIKKSLRSALSALVLPALLISLFSGRSRFEDVPDRSSSFPKREFRGVWIATVDNIDWPSQKNLHPDRQKQEFRSLLDFHKSTGLNAVFVQVRAAGDAFYAKSAEPWSEWLTGRQGREPSPFYDPMEFMIEESHSRGLEFHAWMNLNRLVHKSSVSVSRYNLSYLKPDWVLDYDGYKLFDFGIPEVRAFIVDLIVNVVRNYDVDGIHFDDYFYPYQVAGKVLNDDETFRKYGKGYAGKADWRRANVDQLIKAVHEAIQKTNPKVKFGISPFGVWRNRRDTPEGSETTGGLTSYDHLYADARKWLKEGWLDYIVPQVYFSFGFRRVPYGNLVDWWVDNSFGKHLYIGHAAYRVGTEDTDRNWDSKLELPNQLRFLREKGALGSSFFSSRSLKRNTYGLTDSLRSNFYQYPALVPAMPWKDDIPPLVPKNLSASVNEQDMLEIEWDTPDKARDQELPWYYVLYRFEADERPTNSDPTRIVGMAYGKNSIVDSSAKPGVRYQYFLTSVDRLHNESRPAGPLKLRLQSLEGEE